MRSAAAMVAVTECTATAAVRRALKGRPVTTSETVTSVKSQILLCMYVYMYVCMCVCVCMYDVGYRSPCS